MKRARTLLLCLCLLVPLVGVVAGPAKAAGGPVVLMGIDAEDCGPNQHGPIGNYVSIVNSLLSNTSNGGDGILVIGANGPGPVSFWNAIGSGTGEAITFGNESSSFAGFQVVAIVGSAPETCNGLTQAQNDVLATRQGDFATHINGGGGLFGATQSNFTNQYAYLGGVGSFTSTSIDYDNIDPTPEGQAIGITDALDLCCWHNVFTSFPAFLEVLAFRGGTQEAAAIGGTNVVVTTGIELSPATATNPAGTSHTVTAHVEDSEGVVQTGVLVSFSVTSGPNAGQVSDPNTGECTANNDCTTDANGDVSWTYTSNGQAGTDSIGACFINDSGQETCAPEVEKIWELRTSMTGRAYGLSATVLSQNIIAPTPDTGFVDTEEASTTSTPCVASIPGAVVSADVLCANVTTTVDPASSTATATVAKARLLGPGLPLITATAIESVSKTDCSGSTGGITIARLTVGQKRFLNVRGKVTIPVGDGKVLVNEQVPVPGGLTVNAIHVIIPGVVDVVVASATSDIHDCPSPVVLE